MPSNVIQYKVLISCPGDIDSDIEIITKAIQSFNDIYSDTVDTMLLPKYWRSSGFAQSGGKPQEILNKQLVDDCDVAIAVFWTRFGTPTDKYGSGTEEEIETMLNAGKQVFMYFCERPTSPFAVNTEEIERVRAFRKKYKSKGLSYSYSSDEEFSKLLFAHLSRYFLTLREITALKEERSPQLVLRGIDENNQLCQNAPYQAFKLGSIDSIETYNSKIAKLYRDISAIHVGKAPKIDSNDNSMIANFQRTIMSLNPPVEINPQMRDLISKVALEGGLELPQDFFELGNLSGDNGLSVALGGRRNLNGTKQEIQKYDSIMNLYDTIIECSNWIPIESAFSGLHCIKLAVENCGTTFDEDIEISLEINRDCILILSELPSLENATMKHLLYKYDINSLLGIPSTAQFMDFYSSTHSRQYSSPMPAFSPVGYEQDYTDDYLNALRDVLGYNHLYAENNHLILKVNFGYIKHHTAVAFPAPIFLKFPPKALTYTLTSKNSANVVRGSIIVKST